MLPATDPVVQSLAGAIRRGDVESLVRLVREQPDLAAERFGTDHESRAVLHLATDWPARFPRIAESVAVLVAAGADVNARFVGHHRETPLHWAASADDVDAIDALLDAGADLEADGAVHTGGTPLSDAVVFAQWAAARRLVERGASMTIWQAAALGGLDAVQRSLDAGTATPDDVTNACWHACRAGQLETTRLLVEHGADLDGAGYDHLTPRQAALASGDERLRAYLSGE